ncbi:MAG: transposase, partial [Candidatus Moraniibacteriota bacterium]
VTICTQDKEYFFGEIKNGEMNLNDIGKIAHQFWQEIPQHFPFVNLDQFVVMPDHVHGILEINKNVLNECTRRDEALPRLYMGEYPQMSEISPKPCSLSVIIGAYKSIVSKTANKQFPIGFHWQPRFFDHIIRNDETLNKIREYINKNPARWERDRNSLDSLIPEKHRNDG